MSDPGATGETAVETGAATFEENVGFGGAPSDAEYVRGLTFATGADA